MNTHSPPDSSNKSFGPEGYGKGYLRWARINHPENVEHVELDLFDHTGRLLATLKVSRSDPEQKMLELYVECTESLLTLVLLSGLVVVDAIFERIRLHGKGEAKVLLSSPKKGGM